MTTAITTLRSTVAAALSNPDQWQVLPFVPAAVQANSVVLQPDDPYIEPTNQQWNAISPMARFIVTMIVPLLDNQAALANLENFMVGVFNKLSTSTLSVQMGSITAPKVLGVDSGQMLSADMAIGILTSWS
jgi:hypothetical protein